MGEQDQASPGEWGGSHKKASSDDPNKQHRKLRRKWKEKPRIRLNQRRNARPCGQGYKRVPKKNQSRRGWEPANGGRSLKRAPGTRPRMRREKATMVVGGKCPPVRTGRADACILSKGEVPI